MVTFHPATGKFDLVLSLRFLESEMVGIWTFAMEIEAWRRAFQRASELLYAATDGQHQFGQIFVCPEQTATDEADAWLFKEGGQSYVSAAPDRHVVLMGERRYPFTILHEFGHYLYGLRDEYEDPAGVTAACIGRNGENRLPGACIMEGKSSDGDTYAGDGAGTALVPGDVTDFCVACNHDKGPAGAACIGGFTAYDDEADDTVQSAYNGTSCWETMMAAYPSLSPPGVLPVPATPPDPVDWIVLDPGFLWATVVDVSPDFRAARPDAARGALEAAKTLAYLLPSDAKAGFAVYHGYAETEPMPASLHPLTQAFRVRVEQFLDNLQPTPGSAMGEGILAALDMFQSVQPATTQILLLISGSPLDGGPDPLTFLPILRSRRIRVYAVGVGPNADMDRLVALAEGTGGSWWRLPVAGGPHPFRSVASVVSEFLRKIRAQQVVAATGTAGPGGDADLPPASDGESEAWVEEDAEELCVAAHPDTGQAAELRATSPSGEVFRCAANVGDRGPPVIRVSRPDPGAWTVSAAADDTGDSLPWTASVRSATAGLAVDVPGPIVPGGRAIKVRVSLWAPHALSNVRWAIEVIDPAGRIHKLEGPAEERAQAGTLVTSFRPRSQGVHVVRVVADSREGATLARCCGCAPPTTGRRPQQVVRRAVRAIIVGPEAPAPALRPNVIPRGRSIVELDLNGTPWVPGSSYVALGASLTVVPLRVRPGARIVPLRVQVAKSATAGDRRGFVVTGPVRIHLPYRLDGDMPDALENPERAVLPGRFLAKKLGWQAPRCGWPT